MRQNLALHHVPPSLEFGVILLFGHDAINFGIHQVAMFLHVYLGHSPAHGTFGGAGVIHQGLRELRPCGVHQQFASGDYQVAPGLDLFHLRSDTGHGLGQRLHVHPGLHQLGGIDKDLRNALVSQPLHKCAECVRATFQ